MHYTILFSTAAENMQEVGAPGGEIGDTEEIARADIVVGRSGLILKDRYGNATSVLTDLHRRLTA